MWLFVMAPSCKSKKQELPPFINVGIDVKDEQNKMVENATVFVYNDLKAFETAYQNSLNQSYN